MPGCWLWPPPSHSTLAYANQHRSWETYKALFLSLLAQLRLKLPSSGKSPLGLFGKLLSLDSSVIDLCAKFFPWAKFRATKGAVKLHLLLDHDGLLPHFVLITEGKKADVEVARCRSDNWASQIYPDDFASGLAPGPDATLASAKR